MNENLGKKIVSLSLQILFTTVYGKAIKTVSDSEKNLLKLLNINEKELFQVFSNAQGYLNEVSVAGAFVDGFCICMRIAVEVMQKRY